MALDCRDFGHRWYPQANREDAIAAGAVIGHYNGELKEQYSVVICRIAIPPHILCVQRVEAHAMSQ